MENCSVIRHIEIVKKKKNMEHTASSGLKEGGPSGLLSVLSSKPCVSDGMVAY